MTRSRAREETFDRELQKLIPSSSSWHAWLAATIEECDVRDITRCFVEFHARRRTAALAERPSNAVLEETIGDFDFALGRAALLTDHRPQKMFKG